MKTRVSRESVELGGNRSLTVAALKALSRDCEGAVVSNILNGGRV